MGKPEEELDMLNKHEVIIHEDILPRLEKVEKAQVDFTKQVEDIKDSQKDLQITVMRESSNMQSITKEQGDRMIGIVEGAMNYQSRNDQLEHDLKMQRLNTWANVFLKIIGGLTAVGGIGYVIVQHFLNLIGGN